MFSKAEDEKWEYTIRFNQSIEVPGTHPLQAMDLTARSGEETTDITGATINANTKLYRNSGFLSFQQSVQAFARKAAPGSDVPTINVAKNFPETAYTKVTFWSTISSFFGIIFALALVGSVAFVTQQIVNEKEHRIREAMLIMSLSRSAYYLSWLFTFMASHVVSALLMTLASYVGLFTKTNFGFLFIYYYLFLLSSFSFSFLISSFFSKARVAQIVGLILWFAGGFVGLMMGALANPPREALQALSLFPPVAFGNAGKVFQLLGGNDIGVDFTRMNFQGKDGWRLCSVCVTSD